MLIEGIVVLSARKSDDRIVRSEGLYDSSARDLCPAASAYYLSQVYGEMGKTDLAEKYQRISDELNGSVE